MTDLYSAMSYSVIELTFQGTLKPQRNAPLYSNTVIGTLAVDGWTVTARRGLDRRPVPSSLYQM